MNYLKDCTRKIKKICDAIENEEKIYCLTITYDVIYIEIFESCNISSIGNVVRIKNRNILEDELLYNMCCIFFSIEEAKLHCQSLVNNLRVDY